MRACIGHGHVEPFPHIEDIRRKHIDKKRVAQQLVKFQMEAFEASKKSRSKESKEMSKERGGANLEATIAEL